MAEYVTYRDGDCRDVVVRMVINGNEAEAQQWDYTKGEWVTTAKAWRILAQHDDKLWFLPEEYVKTYIQKMLDEFPSNKNGKPVEEELEGAVRTKDNNGYFIVPQTWEQWKD